MLFRSLPPSQRLSIFLAGLGTSYPLVKWMSGQTPLRASSFIFPLVLWAIVAFGALQRRYPSLQTGGTASAQIDMIYTWFDRWPPSVRFAYWLAVILAAVRIYLFL